MMEEIIKRQKRVSDLCDKLKETNVYTEQRKIMVELYEELLKQNSDLWDENIELKLKLQSLTLN